MKKHYDLAGMGCAGCVTTIKNALLQIPGIEEADVQLKPQSATVTMNQPIDVSVLQSQIGSKGNYTIKEAV